MKALILAVCLSGLGFNAFAGDGYMVTSKALTAILTAPEVQTLASPFYVESIRHFGEILPNKMTYILQLQRDDLNEERFCLVVTVEGTSPYKVTNVQKWVNNSRLCHD